MRYFITGALFTLVVAGTVAIAQGAITQMTDTSSLSRIRPCIYATGTAQEITAAAATSDQSTELTKNTRYAAYCVEEAYVEWAATSAAAVAASGNLIWPADQLMYFLTDDTTLFFAARNTTTDGSCWLLECK